MKQILSLLIALIILAPTFSQTSFLNSTDTFLKKHVVNGRVDYQSIKDNPIKLYELLNMIALQEIPEADRKAYLINAYNILVISNIIENYPINSPEDVPGFFDNEVHIVSNEKMSLNHLEKNLMFKVYNDPRLHFVLVCGAIGCPPITNFAYKTDELDAQLNKQTTLALNSDFLRVDDTKKTLQVSEIFKWYASDFGGNNKSVLAYINSYRTSPIPSNYKIGFYNYNWKLNTQINATVSNREPFEAKKNNSSTNLQTFTAGSLLRKNQFDYTLFNTMYTESKGNWLGIDNSDYRNTFVTHLAQITYGITKNKRINIGLDLNFRYNGRVLDNGDFSGISKAFSFENDTNSRVGITAVGFRIKVQPFKAVADFSIQSTIQVPIIKDAEGTASLYWGDWDRITWWNQFFYTKTFNKIQVFGEIDLLFRFKKYESQIGMLDIPLNLFLSYFPTPKVTLYAMTQHVPRLTNNITPSDLGVVETDWVIPSNYTASGFGAKYQITSQMNLEVLYSNFWRGTNSGLGNTFNFGIKYITK
ncbi:MAG: DUF547 domain-containing protein [Crocinitomicaceae bacterium]